MRPKWKLMGIRDQLLRFLSVCILIWFLLLTTREDLECVLHQDHVVHSVIWESSELETRFPKGKIWELMLSGRQGWANARL